MGKFGWSLPPGCRRLPGEEQEGPVALKCPTCGRFIKIKQTRAEPWEDSFVNDDPRFGLVGEKIILAADVTLYYTCSRCGEIRDPLPVFV